MSDDLRDFFSLIGKAKKEKEEEFRSLVGEIDIDSIFSTVKSSLEEEKKAKEKKVKEEKKRKEKEARQAKALEEWLFGDTKKEEDVKSELQSISESSSFEVIDLIEKEPIKQDIEIQKISETIINGQIKIGSEENDVQINEVEVEVEVEQEEEQENDTIDHALKILEQLKTKEEVQTNTKDPEILKIRKELEYLKNLVNAQGGGGEVRLEFLDDVDRSSAKVNNRFLKYDSASDKWIGAVGGSGGSQTLNDTLGLGNTSNIGMSVGVVTATYFVGDGSLLTNLPGGGGNSGYANTAGIATYATTAGIATYATSSGIATYATTSGVSTVSQGLTGTPSIIVANITAVDASFSGNVSVAGTITYEDVTNVDSIGVITARSGILVGPLTSIGATISSGGNASFAGVVTATSFQGNATSSNYANVSGISTTSQGLTGSPNVQLGFTTITGVGNTALFVDGDVRITGILTIGTNTLTLDGSTNTVQIGSGVTITEGGNANYSGIITATTFDAESVTLSSLTLPDGIFSSGVTTTSSSTETSIDSFAANAYRSAKYQIQITRGSEYQITEIFIVHDDISSYGTEYATIKTDTTLSTFSTDILSGNVRLLATPSSSSFTTFKLIRTLIEI